MSDEPNMRRRSSRTKKRAVTYTPTKTRPFSVSAGSPISNQEAPEADASVGCKRSLMSTAGTNQNVGIPGEETLNTNIHAGGTDVENTAPAGAVRSTHGSKAPSTKSKRTSKALSTKRAPLRHVPVNVSVDQKVDGSSNRAEHSADQCDLHIPAGQVELQQLKAASNDSNDKTVGAVVPKDAKETKKQAKAKAKAAAAEKKKARKEEKKAEAASQKKVDKAVKNVTRAETIMELQELLGMTGGNATTLPDTKRAKRLDEATTRHVRKLLPNEVDPASIAPQRFALRTWLRQLCSLDVVEKKKPNSPLSLLLNGIGAVDAGRARAVSTALMALTTNDQLPAFVFMMYQTLLSTRFLTSKYYDGSLLQCLIQDTDVAKKWQAMVKAALPTAHHMDLMLLRGMFYQVTADAFQRIWLCIWKAHLPADSKNGSAELVFDNHALMSSTTRDYIAGYVLRVTMRHAYMNTVRNRQDLKNSYKISMPKLRKYYEAVAQYNMLKTCTVSGGDSGTSDGFKALNQGGLLCPNRKWSKFVETALQSTTFRQLNENNNHFPPSVHKAFRELYPWLTNKTVWPKIRNDVMNQGIYSRIAIDKAELKQQLDEIERNCSFLWRGLEKEVLCHIANIYIAEMLRHIKHRAVDDPVQESLRNRLKPRPTGDVIVISE